MADDTTNPPYEGVADGLNKESIRCPMCHITGQWIEGNIVYTPLWIEGQLEPKSNPPQAENLMYQIVCSRCGVIQFFSVKVSTDKNRLRTHT